MPSTRQLKSFKVRNTEGNEITVQRRCLGDGKLVQKQLEGLVYDEKAKKFRTAKDVKAKKAAEKAEGREHVLEDLNKK